MAKVTLSPLFESASGKLCKHDNQYVACNKHTGKMYVAESHPGEQPNSEKQQAVRATFTSKSAAASAWWNANKPTDSNPTGTADYQLLMKKYKAQKSYGNPYNYLRSLVQDDLTIKIGTTTSAAPVTPGSGGTSSGGGGGERVE